MGQRFQQSLCKERYSSILGGSWISVCLVSCMPDVSLSFEIQHACMKFLRAEDDWLIQIT